MPINSAPVLVDAKDLIQINATMLTGILIFYTIPYITRGWKTAKTIVYVRGPAKVEKKYKPVTENAVLTLIAVAIVLFIVSTILAFVAIFPLPISYWFVAIGAAAIIFIKVIQKVKEQTSEEKAIEQQAKAVEREMMEREKALQSPFEPDPNQTPTAADQWKKDEEKRQQKRAKQPSPPPPPDCIR